MLPHRRRGTNDELRRWRRWPAAIALLAVAVGAGQPDPAGAACRPGPTNLCLASNRFRVEVDWHDFSGRGGPAQSIAGTSDARSGLFWFLTRDNWEVMVKVLDGCRLNGRYWVFAAAATTLEYTITVTDTATGAVRTYQNPLGTSSPAVTDIDAFRTCAPADGLAAGAWTPCTFAGTDETTHCALAPMPLGPRWGHASAALDGEVFVVGGQRAFDASAGGTNRLDTVEAYDPATNRWRDDIARLPVPVVNPNVVAADGRLYVLGFLDDPTAHTASGRVFAYDPERDVWEERASMPSGTERGDSGTAVWNGVIYVGGGWRDGAAVANFSAYDPAADRWSTLPSLPTARASLLAGAAGGRIAFLGGATAVGDALGTRAVEIYSPATATWAAGKSIPIVAGQPLDGGDSRAVGVFGATLGDRIYILGGSRGLEPNYWGVFFTNQAYAPAIDRWTDEAPLETPRRDSAAAALGSRIYVTGGSRAVRDDSLAAYRPLGD